MFKKFWLAMILCLIVPVGAMAQEATDDVEFDKYSTTTEQLLMLKGVLNTTLPAPLVDKFFFIHGFNRFKTAITESDPNTAAVQQWCMTAVAGTQTRRGALDQNMEVEITQRAVEERCSDVFKYDADVIHNCVRKTTEEGKPYLACTLNSKITFSKFKAMAANGKVSWVPDTTFGKGGKVEVKSSQRASASLDKGTTVEQATASALNTLVPMTAIFGKRKMLDVQQFQVHVPVISAKKGVAKSCLGRDTVELDLPFIVMVNAGGKEVRKGFVKARKIYDGCDETPEILEQAAKSKRKPEIKPMEAQIILGGKDVKAGHTMWEMPSIGLNVGGGLSFSQAMGGVGSGTFKMWAAPAVNAEFNLAPYTGISEFHVWGSLKFSGFDDAYLNNEFDKLVSSLTSESVGSGDVTFMFQFDAGVLKRWYSRFFIFGLMGGINLGYYASLANLGDYSVGALGVGLSGQIELGFQLAPRFILDFRFGYRFEAGLAMLSDGTDAVGDPKFIGVFHGPVATLNLAYNF